MTNQANLVPGLKELCDELMSVVERYQGADLPALRKSATSFGKLVDNVLNAAVTEEVTSLAVTTMSAKDLIAKHMSALGDYPNAPAARDVDWAIDNLAAELRGMLDATNDQGARDLINALGVAVAGVAQVVEHGGAGHTLVLAEKQNGKICVEAQKMSAEALRRLRRA